jgi:membrane protease YdiL (CAAX protease family)
VWRPVPAIAVTLVISIFAYIALPYCLGAPGGDRSLSLSLLEQAVVIVLVLVALGKGDAADALALTSRRDLPGVMVASAAAVGCAIAALLVRHQLSVTTGFVPHAASGMGPIIDAMSAGFAFVIAAPFAEEILFRGFLLPALTASRLGFWGGASVSSAIWANMHLLNVGYGVLSIGLIFLGGLGLSYLRRRSGTLWPCIVVHGCYNMFPAAGILVWPG